MKVLILAADGVDFDEVNSLTTYFQRHGAGVQIASCEKGPVRTWDGNQWQAAVHASLKFSEVQTSNYDAIVIPSGELHIAKLLSVEAAGDIVRSAHSLKRVIGASRYGVALLVSTGVVQGLTVTSCESLKTFVVNAGAEWSSKEIEVDQSVVTVRRAGIPKLARTILDEIPAAALLRVEAEKQFGKILEHV